MKENAALFPFDKNILPVARHFRSLQNIYELQKVIAWSGCGAIGKDAAFICNQPAIGITITDQLTENNSEWDTLIVDCTSIDTARKSSDDMENLFRACLEKNKKILLIADDAHYCRYYGALHEKYPDRICCLDNSLSVQRNHFRNIQYVPLSTPVLLIGGLVKTGDTLEILLSLKEQFDAHDRKISCITGNNLGMLFGCHSYTHIFENGDYSEERKILELNQFTRDIIEAERPELVVIEAPDAVMKFSNLVPNGFGIQTYMVTQALNPDFCICSMPNDLVNPSFINHLIQGMLKHSGLNVYAVYASNVIVDFSDALQDQALSYLYIDMNEVSNTLKNTPQQDSMYICNTVLQGGEDLFSHISKLIERGV